MCAHDDGLTDGQREFVDTVDTVSDAPIFPGVCGACADCQSDFGMTLDDSGLWELRLYSPHSFALVDRFTGQHTLIEFAGEDAIAFLERWEIGTDDPEALASTLWEEADYDSRADDIPNDARSEIFSEMISAGEINDEGGFSWSACDCCGSSLGGNRYAAHSVEPEGGIVHWSICEDCLQYLANGYVPERPFE